MWIQERTFVPFAAQGGQPRAPKNAYDRLFAAGTQRLRRRGH